MVSVDLQPKMADIVELDLLFTVPDHKSSSIKFHILSVDGCRENIVVVKILPLTLRNIRGGIDLVVTLSLTLRSRTLSLGIWLLTLDCLS